ncbi:MAG: carboxypeptidase regulatory-like domain-containing protein [Acidobacteriota bacterium]|nr:carboxypeptidase regulatory-like domain-containing protein [Acidobacteriota bacterium]
MILPLVISFSRRSATALLIAFRLAAAVTGHVTLIDSRAKKSGDFSGVVVWLQPIDDPAAPPPRTRATMLQKNKQFVPHILAIGAGSTVSFPNLDPIFHSAFSNFEGQIFDIALYPPGTSRGVRFERPGIVRVFCNIHPAMSAVIVVVNSRYFAITGMDGRYVLPNVPPGKYELRCFYERATAETLAGLSQSVSVTKPDLELPLLAISEAGYLPLPHKNKYGRPYPVPADEARPYSN